jgi:hypothetical protein
MPGAGHHYVAFPNMTCPSIWNYSSPITLMLCLMYPLLGRGCCLGPGKERGGGGQSHLVKSLHPKQGNLLCSEKFTGFLQNHHSSLHKKLVGDQLKKMIPFS